MASGGNPKSMRLADYEADLDEVMEAPIRLPNQTGEARMEVKLLSNKQPTTVAHEKARLLGSGFNPADYRMRVRPYDRDPHHELCGTKSEDPTTMDDKANIIQYSDILERGFIFFEKIVEQQDPDGDQSLPDHEAEIDSFIDARVQLPDEKQCKLRDVRLLTNNLQPCTVARAKAEVLGSAFNASEFSMVVRPFNPGQGLSGIPVAHTIEDKQTVLDDSENMLKYVDEISTGVVCFERIQQ